MHATLAWMDLEMTGLDPDKDTILEIATILTDNELNVVAEGPCLTIRHSEAQLAAMDPWCVDQHGKSGLAEKARKSTITLDEAEKLTYEFVKAHLPERKAPLCGNTIWQDRRFLAKHMPRLHEYFHYRSIDVSTIKELVQRWYPASQFIYPKAKRHMALDDIKESIQEMAYYRKTIFK